MHLVKKSIALVVMLLPVALNAEVPADPVPNVASLPSSYPDTWLFVHESNAHNGMIGQTLIVDAASANRHLKGSIQSSLLGNFAEAKSRSELYANETVYSRGTYGERTDLIVVYDKATLNPIAEIVLPAEKRALMMPRKAMFTLSGDEQFGLVYNFTPAASVTVVDLIKRAVVGEVNIPGCTMIYPMGPRSFITLCGNGSMAAIALDSDGKLASENVSKVFNDIDKDPLFMDSALVNDVRYFVSFRGHVQPLGLAGGAGTILKTWSLLDAADAKESWRPSGAQVLSADRAGRLYVLMRKGARDGEHGAGGGEVWVYDVSSQTRLMRIPLRKEGRVIEATRGQEALLAVVNADQELDVYAADSGKFIRRIGGWRDITPFSLYAVK
ncbi:amine dehydrogenase large subunit [Sphingosinicella microcystinivorans]|uniref:amine dehydrogenase large subunit n=1 Tax=Sphingosinicella microcystinivorans TaxID=335406 RepID=UPI0022F3EF52|nr:amine dehydrogenase large subunit [Sphingosinicella microcystinivorans]WBX84619.1 amine dehydrogenase large subunit [Sphingosinicella microcystinivorans]